MCGFRTGIEYDAFAIPLRKSPDHGSGNDVILFICEHKCGVCRKYFARFILQGQAAAADECFQLRDVGIDFKAAAHKFIR